MAPEHYKAEQLQEPVEVFRPTLSADGSGGSATSEVSQGTHLAFVRPLRGSERLLNAGEAGVVEVLFVLYAAVGVQRTDVLVYNGSRYNIRAVLPPGLSKFQEIEAESGVVV